MEKHSRYVDTHTSRATCEQKKQAAIGKNSKIRYTTKDMPKRTHQPHKRHRARTHGFRARIATKAGRAILKRRTAKGRARLTI